MIELLKSTKRGETLMKDRQLEEELNQLSIRTWTRFHDDPIANPSKIEPFPPVKLLFRKNPYIVDLATSGRGKLYAGITEAYSFISYVIHLVYIGDGYGW